MRRAPTKLLARIIQLIDRRPKAAGRKQKIESRAQTPAHSQRPAVSAASASGAVSGAVARPLGRAPAELQSPKCKLAEPAAVIDETVCIRFVVTTRQR